MARTVIPVTDLTPPKAAYTTALTGNNNDLVFTARNGGPGGNSITITYTDPGGVTATLAVTVAGWDIDVSLARAASAITTTAAQLAAAIAADPDANALVTVANASSNDGTGIVTAMTVQSLTGGRISTAQPSLVNGDATNDHYLTGNDGEVIVEVVSSDAGAQTVTVQFAPGAVSRLVEPSGLAETIEAGTTRLLGPFDPDVFNQNADGDVYLDPSVSNTLDFRAYRITSAA